MALCKSVENYLSKSRSNGRLQTPMASGIRSKSIRWIDEVDHGSDLSTSWPNLEKYSNVKPERSIKRASLDFSPPCNVSKHSIRLVRKTSARQCQSILEVNCSTRKKSLDSSDDFTGSTSSISLSETENDSCDESSVSSTSTGGRTTQASNAVYYVVQNSGQLKEEVDSDNDSSNFCTAVPTSVGSWYPLVNEAWADDSFMETNQPHDIRRREISAWNEPNLSKFKNRQCMTVRSNCEDFLCKSCATTSTVTEDVKPRIAFPPPPPPRPPHRSLRKMNSLDSNFSGATSPSAQCRSGSGVRSIGTGKSSGRSFSKIDIKTDSSTRDSSKILTAEDYEDGSRCKKSSGEDFSIRGRGKPGKTSTSCLRKRGELLSFDLSSSLTEIVEALDQHFADEQHATSCHEFGHSNGEGSGNCDLEPRARNRSRGWIVKDMPYKTVMGLGIYSGQVNNFSIPSGRGKIVFDNGNVYDGEWRNGNPVELSR